MNISKMGYREIKEAAAILNDIADNGCPDNLDGDSMDIGFNENSGCVYAFDEDCNCFMMNGDTLEQWYNCPICGHEGFLEDMEHNLDDKECLSYLDDIGYIELFMSDFILSLLSAK